MTTKPCGKCGIPKVLSEFYSDGRSRHVGTCKACKRKAAADQRAPRTEKVCTQCDQTLPLEEFYVSNRKTGARRSECRRCQRDRIYERRGFRPTDRPVMSNLPWQTQRKDEEARALASRVRRHADDPAVKLYRAAVNDPKRKRRFAAQRKALDAAVRPLLMPVDWIRQFRPSAPVDAPVRLARHEDESDMARLYEGRSA
jgi:hypothetical protein